MKHIVYRGTLRTAVAARIEFPRGVPVPVKPELAERLLLIPDFEDATPKKASKPSKATKSESEPETTPTPEEQPADPAELTTGLWAR